MITMQFDKSHDYVFRIGSDNQHRIHWDGKLWQYEFLAGGVVFDNQSAPEEEGLEDILFAHGLRREQFAIDASKAAAQYSSDIKTKMAKLVEHGVVPCPKHGLSAKNLDNTCEACEHSDYFDDHKGTEG
jgi:hypothetical protein